MSLMDGKRDPVEVHNYQMSHVRMWGEITDSMKSVIVTHCRRCGAHATHNTPQGARKFKTEHQDQNNVCPYEKEVKY